MMTVLSLMYMRPKAQVRPSRQSRAMAPITQDLQGEEDMLNHYLLCHIIRNVRNVSFIKEDNTRGLSLCPGSEKAIQQSLMHVGP